MKFQGHHLTTFQRKILLKDLQEELRPEYRRRIEIMLLADEGKTQAEICEELGCSQETARYWINMAQLGNAHYWNEQPLGRPKIVNEEYIVNLKQLVSRNPRDFGYPFQRWTAQWLRKHLAKELGIEVSDRHINRLLKNMGLSTRGYDRVEKLTNTSDTANISIDDLQSSTASHFLWSLNPIKNSQ